MLTRLDDVYSRIVLISNHVINRSLVLMVQLVVCLELKQLTYYNIDRCK